MEDNSTADSVVWDSQDVEEMNQVEDLLICLSDDGSTVRRVPTAVCWCGGISLGHSETSAPLIAPQSNASTSETILVPIPDPPISGFMLATEVIAHLRDHGCQDITNSLDFESCTAYPISTGGFGDVYRGRLLDGSQIAIKTMKIRVDADEVQKPLKHAARELYTWSKCQHPNVLGLLGLVGFRDQIGMVSNWMQNGSLLSYLERQPKTDRCRISAEICQGLAYLHAEKIIHGDLKGPNVLISNDGTPMLTDFGNAILQESTLRFTATTTKYAISARWAAPELLEGLGMHSFAADVYALGMTILETITGQVPYCEKSEIGVYLALVKKELPPLPEKSIPSNSKDGNKLRTLLTSCWAYDPKNRPSVGHVQDTVYTITQEGLNSVQEFASLQLPSQSQPAYHPLTGTLCGSMATAVASSTRTKNGCWSCRVRRKKCVKGSSNRQGICDNCARLEIECLGWGAKRPDWMRDKSKVKTWKENVTQTLKEKGMIRGVPRTNQPAPTPFTYNPHARPAANLPTEARAATAATTLFPVTGSDLRGVVYTQPVPQEVSDSDESEKYDCESTGDDLDTIGDNIIGRMDKDFDQPESFNQTTAPSSIVFGPMAPYIQQSEWANYNSGYQANAVYTAWQDQPAGYGFTVPSMQYQDPAHFTPPVLRTPTMGLDQDRLHRMLILYYIKHVRKMQYVFAGDVTTNVMIHHAQMDPHGVVSLALCSLAALHDSRMRIANGIMPDDQRARAPADKYYQKALQQLQWNKLRNGVLTDADATAALHLVSFWLFAGGSGDWPVALQIAGDWYEQVNLSAHENPMRALMEMNDNAKHASKTTMWMDIFSSISLGKSPRFLKLYRRLLQPNTSFFPGPTGQGLQLENVMGCADGIMLCLAEIADLACWKAEQESKGCLSMPELIRRGLVIEKDLRREGHSLGRNRADTSSVWGSVPSTGTPNMELPAGVRLGQSISPPSPPPLPSQVLNGEELRRLVSDIFREAAILYLHTVLFGLRPQVAEIKRAVTDTVDALVKLPCSEYDRSLVLPFVLVGCSTDDPEVRDYVRCRIKQLNSAASNCATAGELIEYVWARRDSNYGLTIGWREAMEEINMKILLV